MFRSLLTAWKPYDTFPELALEFIFAIRNQEAMSQFAVFAIVDRESYFSRSRPFPFIPQTRAARAFHAAIARYGRKRTPSDPPACTDTDISEFRRPMCSLPGTLSTGPFRRLMAHDAFHPGDGFEKERK